MIKRLRAYVEGLHRFKSDNSFVLRVIGKYSRITEQEALEKTYQRSQGHAEAPYPTAKGIQLVLDEIGSRNSKAKSLAPANFIDVDYLKELKQSGFVKKLCGE